MENKYFITVAELAKILNISRIAVFKKIKKGQIKASKVGRAYVIDKKDLPFISAKALSAQQKQKIDQAVAKTVREYGETLKLLGRE